LLAFLKRFRELLLVVALLLFPAGTYIANAKQGRELSSLDRFFLAASAPISQVVDATVGGLLGLWNDYVALRGVHEENVRLRAELYRAREQLNQNRETLLENERLRGLLAYAQAGEGRLVAAPVVGVSPTHRRSITIAKGAGEGVAPGMAVVTDDGVVGKVTATYGAYAEVQLLVDANFAIAARVQRSRFRVTARGTGDEGSLRLDNALRTGDIEEGDILVTSGTDRVFPKGLVIGRVKELDRRPHGMYVGGEIAPAVDVSGLEEVLVVVVPADRPDPALSIDGAPAPAVVVPGAP
jgi:rod shape-determining protein MreC